MSSPAHRLDHGAEPITLQLGEDHADIREAVRRVCAGFPQEYWRGLEDGEKYPTGFIDALTEAGFLAALIPEQYGGSGLPLRAAAVIMEEICAAGCHAAAGHAQMYIMGTVLRHGSEEQKQRYLPEIAAGRLRLQAFGVTEPTTGSDTTQLKTRATRTDKGYRLNGQKVWTSRALHSDLMLVLARTTPAAEVKSKTEGISTFLIDIRAGLGKGLTIRPIQAMVNHHATEVFFEDLDVPADALVGEEGKGFRYILDGMNAERMITAAEAIGSTRWFVRTATAYANERVVFKRPIGANQAIQFPIAQAHVQMEAADMMVRRATALFEAGLPCGAEANMARYLAAECLWNAAEACMQTHGGFGFAREYNVERKWREARLARIAPVSTNLILANIAQNVLGLPRSY
ncbi:acyl-CoA dehydrogenase family protein [Ramlibacter tataouinensis]|uniref:Acyl-CoA dehydrogenase-like protein n=1 Tax=Ramlibacter tataouinensis (strain ATCC BAA-407 / DSM 14655 / LMG 21543 / TTB310) TaxID=365046 RepID=F5Y443_RAMTT|nr:acyl-CoA dehydrogenase family protein [Ramlibacter tataouinensis]AEG92508.1 acyl-CoA dehydrogenase-like protein [Ramlibacter tataouinensis TTB310]